MATLRERSRQIGAAVASIVGPDEIQFWLGLVLVAVGSWPWLGRGALVVPGGILIWSSLPSRAPFVAHPVEKSERRKVA